MKLAAILSIVLGLLLSQKITVSGIQCYQCTWIDSNDEELKVAAKHTDECKTLDDTSKAQLTPAGRSINSRGDDDPNIADPTSSSASSSSSMAAQIPGYDTRGRIGETAEICVKIFGRSGGTRYVYRTGLFGSLVRDKGNICDDGSIVPFTILFRNPEEKRVCWCNKDKCNTDKELEKLGLNEKFKDEEGQTQGNRYSGESATLKTRETLFKTIAFLLFVYKTIF